MSRSGPRSCVAATSRANNIATIRSNPVTRAQSLHSLREMPSNIERLSSGVGSGLIEFVCVSHEPHEEGPTVTPIRVGWGYCPGAGTGRHTWRQIEPTTRERLERHVLAQRLKPLK